MGRIDQKTRAASPRALRSGTGSRLDRCVGFERSAVARGLGDAFPDEARPVIPKAILRTIATLPIPARAIPARFASRMFRSIGISGVRSVEELQVRCGPAEGEFRFARATNTNPVVGELDVLARIDVWHMAGDAIAAWPDAAGGSDGSRPVRGTGSRMTGQADLPI